MKKDLVVRQYWFFEAMETGNYTFDARRAHLVPFPDRSAQLRGIFSAITDRVGRQWNDMRFALMRGNTNFKREDVQDTWTGTVGIDHPRPGR